MKLYLLLAGLLASGLASRAQTPAPAAAQAAAPTPQLAPRADTVAALHRLFARRRRQFLVIGAGGAALSIGSSIVWSRVAVETRTGGSIIRPLFPPETYPIIGVSVGIGFGIVGAALAGDFGPRREAETVRRYEAGHPLSAALRRRLRLR
ncbi:hypothetical protein [Hymenobacter edaphi]|uniref:DUF3185 domain-containing protein n=1 Tax=Hymenobacter edaphi TaxID=2211146 RepID=A0A328BD96_9BACT|nr:hypothetical protein [Hymenobacter edaphi]RAK63816.1 hypothetical protein DLM85_19900 [Hymenobacter edaphi]